MKKKERVVPTNFQSEIIDVRPSSNENISKCTIRIMYHGKNRNGMYISKVVAEEMASSLPLTPIVGFYDEEEGDFQDHGEEIIINHKGISVNKKTVPYGAVSEVEPVFWEEYQDANGDTKEYLTAYGYLWTGRYPELKTLLENSKGQSMELFGEKTEGVWAILDNDEYETYVVDRAEISALCILGDDVEPCFEDANIQTIDSYFSLDGDNFKKEFSDFMKEVRSMDFAKGGKDLEKNKEANQEALDAVKKAEESKKAEDVKSAKELVGKLEDEDKKESLKERLDKIEVEEEKEDSKEEKEEKDEPAEENTLEEEVEEVEEPALDNSLEEDEEGEEKEFSLTEEQVLELFNSHKELQEKYAELEAKTEEISSLYTKSIEESKAQELEDKNAMCEKFSALGEDTINKIKENLDNFSLDELEKELSALAFKKGLSFSNLGDDNIVTMLPGTGSKNAMPDWITAIEKQEGKY